MTVYVQPAVAHGVYNHGGHGGRRRSPPKGQQAGKPPKVAYIFNSIPESEITGPHSRDRYAKAFGAEDLAGVVGIFNN